ncbi:Uncharacterized protein dnm_026200 [Desulfonema magnum]|uniref:Uncharacterized protein n=1 Tax=Desulfonema magnum TaxID=45655 RepID=A0A975BJH2_9BACT|nr:Uncharacterized protein dnm_026200 [Desulfonema magnum]
MVREVRKATRPLNFSSERRGCAGKRQNGHSGNIHKKLQTDMSGYNS